MKSFLHSIDLWLLTGETGTARVDQPGYADPQNPTADETRAIQAWDTADSRSQGILYLHMTEPAKQRVEAGVGTASTACLVWQQAEAIYGAITPAKVYSLFRQTRQWHLDRSKHPQPQLDALDYLYKQLTTQMVNIANFIKAMMLLCMLPPQWEESITTIVMQSGTITGITYDAAKTAILRHWDALNARKSGKKAQQVSKISSILRKGPTPSFQNQTAPSQHSGSGGSSTSGKKKGKARGARGKGKGRARRQGYGKVHLVSSISAAPSTSHSVTTIMPQGLLQCIAVEEPEASSYGDRPYSSFNEAMTLTQCLGDRPSPRTVQAIEEVVMSAPTPCSSPPPLSPAESTNSRDPVETRRAASAPPLPEEVADEFGYTTKMCTSISPCLLPEAARPPINGGKSCKLPMYCAPTPEEDTVSLFGDTELQWNGEERGASGWEDLYMGDDRYVRYELTV